MTLKRATNRRDIRPPHLEIFSVTPFYHKVAGCWFLILDIFRYWVNFSHRWTTQIYPVRWVNNPVQYCICNCIVIEIGICRDLFPALYSVYYHFRVWLYLLRGKHFLLCILQAIYWVLHTPSVILRVTLCFF